MRIHKTLDVSDDPNQSDADTISAFDKLAKDGYKFLTWVSPWHEYRPNGFPKFRRTAMFYKDAPDA